MTWFDLPKELRSTLLDVSDLSDAVSGRIHYQELPQSSVYPHIWFTRNSRNELDHDLDGDPEQTIDRFTFEVIADADAESVVDLLESTLRNFSGNVGSRYVQWVEIEDAEDDYEFQSVGEGEPLYLHAIQVAVYHFDQ